MQHKILIIPEKRREVEFYEVLDVYGNLVETIPQEYLQVELGKFQADKYFIMTAKDDQNRFVRLLVYGVQIENGPKLPNIIEA